MRCKPYLTKLEREINLNETITEVDVFLDAIEIPQGGPKASNNDI